MAKLLRTFFLLTWVACLAPASEIDGRWNFTYVTPEGDLRATVTLSVEGEQLLFVQNGQEFVGSYRDGEFQIEAKGYYSGEAGYSADLILEGKVKDDEISGKWSFDVYSGTFSAKRSGS